MVALFTCKWKAWALPALISATLLAAATLLPALQLRPVTPLEDSVFTSTRYVTGIAVAPDGRVWAATLGGVLHRTPGGDWQKSTTADGLPSNEVSSVRLEGETVIAVTPVGTATWQAGRWVKDATPRPAPIRYTPGQTCAVEWKGQVWAASAWEFLSPQRFYLFTSLYHSDLHMTRWASHISALLPQSDWLWVALYGEGIVAYDGKSKWTRPIDNLPGGALEITALGGDAKHLWVGTRREGLWEYDGKLWTQHLRELDPYDHNCQALVMYDDRLIMSTLEDGLVVKGPAWAIVQAPEISTNSPRQMVVYQGRLFVRHGGGQVDVFDGKAWRLNICSTLPRKEVTALAGDGARLYAAQWGGWSEFDGKAWTHYLKEKDLQGVPVLALYPDGDVLWVSTQKRGLGGYHRKTGAWEWHDERRGLPDDWVKSAIRAGNTLYAGTFVGGLTRRAGDKWAAVPGLAAGEITALEPDGRGGLYAGTRAGAWQVPAQSAPAPLAARVPFVGSEVQALCRVPEGLWVGTRTGLYFISQHTLAE